MYLSHSFSIMASQIESIKWVKGTRFIVDGFRFQDPSRCRHYFLTHAHSDHTTGLTKSFCAGLIYCTEITSRLLITELGIARQHIRVLSLDQEVCIDGIKVTPLDANHCPGACMFKFVVPEKHHPHETGDPLHDDFRDAPYLSTVILHTGDFRWCSERHGTHPALDGGCDVLMLDTTYCGPRWTFPPQNEAIHLMVNAAQDEIHAEPMTLFVCMSYHIGKERAYFGLATAMGWKVWCSASKRRTLRLLDLPESWMALVTDRQDEAQLHVLSMGEQLHTQALADRIAGSRWKRVVLFRPTGWTYSNRRRGGVGSMTDEGVVRTIGVPYSEHSSFLELQDCVKALKPKRIVPTVNATDSSKSRALVDLLSGCMDLSEDKGRLPAYFLTQSQKKERTSSPTDDLVTLDEIDVEEQCKILLEIHKRQGKERHQGESAVATKRGRKIWEYFSRE